MTSDQLTIIAGALLALAFSYVPGLAEKYQAKDETTKRLIMLGLLVLVAAGSFGLACGGVVEFAGGVACNRSGLVNLVQSLIFAIASNQGVYKLTKRPSPTTDNSVL